MLKIKDNVDLKYKLKDGVDVNRLLILTFTKAAAGEMADRVRKKIKNRSYQFSLI